MIEYSSACFSKGKPDWGTPPKLFQELSEEFGPFQLDAATREDNPLGTPLFFTKENSAFLYTWFDKGPVFINPPYGKEVIKWVRGAWYAALYGALVVMLLLARTDTKWFHEYIYDNKICDVLIPKPTVEVRFLRGRQKMIDLDNPTKKPNTAPFPSMVVIFHPNVTQ
jgi:phage N-6-adenine-methyltransferase